MPRAREMNLSVCGNNHVGTATLGCPVERSSARSIGATKLGHHRRILERLFTYRPLVQHDHEKSPDLCGPGFSVACRSPALALLET